MVLTAAYLVAGVRVNQAVAYPTQQSFLKQMWKAIVA